MNKIVKVAVRVMTVLSFTYANITFATAHNERPWEVAFEALESAERIHASALESVQDIIENGSHQEDSVSQLSVAHDQLADALSNSKRAIEERKRELVKNIVACVTSTKASEVGCVEESQSLTSFISWTNQVEDIQVLFGIRLLLSGEFIKFYEAKL